MKKAHESLLDRYPQLGLVSPEAKGSRQASLRLLERGFYLATGLGFGLAGGYSLGITVGGLPTILAAGAALVVGGICFVASRKLRD